MMVEHSFCEAQFFILCFNELIEEDKNKSKQLSHHQQLIIMPTTSEVDDYIAKNVLHHVKEAIDYVSLHPSSRLGTAKPLLESTRNCLQSIFDSSLVELGRQVAAIQPRGFTPPTNTTSSTTLTTVAPSTTTATNAVPSTTSVTTTSTPPPLPVVQTITVPPPPMQATSSPQQQQQLRLQQKLQQFQAHSKSEFEDLTDDEIEVSDPYNWVCNMCVLS
jgi:hypothetical protein